MLLCYKTLGCKGHLELGTVKEIAGGYGAWGRSKEYNEGEFIRTWP